MSRMGFYSICLLLVFEEVFFVKSEVMSSRDVIEVKLLSDFVDFHKYSHVCLVKTPEISTNSSNRGRIRTQWETQMFRFLGGSSNAGPYTCVTDVLSLVDGGLFLKTRSLPGLEKEGDKAPIDGSQGLLVYRLETESDLKWFRKMFRGKTTGYHWLLFTHDDFFALLKTIFWPISNKVTVASMVDSTTDWKLSEIYQVTEALEHRVSQVGRWTAHHESSGNPKTFKDTEDLPLKDRRKRSFRYGMLDLPDTDYTKRRINLTGLHLRCTTVEQAPMAVLKNNPDGSVTIIGVLGDLLTTLREVTNLTYRCHRVKDGGWGSKVKGRWNGMIGEVKRGEADIAVAALDITPERSTAADFLVGMLYGRYRIVMRRPSSADFVWTAYVMQFQKNVWIVLGITVGILMVSMLLMSHWSRTEVSFSVSDVFIIVAGCMFGQGSSIAMKYTSGRLLLLSCLLLQILLMAHYTSDLISGLAMGPPLPSVNTIDDINRNKKLTLGWRKGSSLGEVFKTSVSPTYRKVWTKVEETNMEPLTLSMDEAFSKVLEEPYLFISSEVAILYTFGQDCRVYILPTSYFPVQQSFALKKGSPLIPILNKVILDIWSTGMIDKWKTKWSPATSDCNILETKPIVLKTLLTIFLVLASAMAISVVFMLVERRFKKGVSKF
ncbi:probable glutamate receptor [Penaeus japonicus]|uniref:probable glutamate receptor n=1 Tax=Penaeus japonicus TaxID=27405 RepID=UPI001C710FDC|nr:probable glutamate receptor [Penaeus japonicus]